jgi:hypothetical protein
MRDPQKGGRLKFGLEFSYEFIDMDFWQIVPLLNYYWGEVVCPLRNHMYPALKLKGKVYVKSRKRCVYDKPTTPRVSFIV